MTAELQSAGLRESARVVAEYLRSGMTVKPFQHSDNNQSPLSVLDILFIDSPDTVVKQRPSLSKLPPKSGLQLNASCQRFSTDSRGSVEGIRPVLTACQTSPTRPKPHGRIRVPPSLLSRSSSLTDNKVRQQEFLLCAEKSMQQPPGQSSPAGPGGHKAAEDSKPSMPRSLHV